ncbi:XRE family transcriptional regulator [Amycolatopsis antarctica]|uniref:XRE family transcriptional regulator n=1 Tax=Amycolatopsis antarctica TaxID=1854586 RepID=A0A263D6G7_9PSEU|nr:DUF5919 domain-containing protein [Amycolatopsis antarctica]OZM73628.1 XRE family transcriptional regulator [Amycolatopsis antarctica]
MPNERLRDTLLRNGLTLQQVAEVTDVDPKTVERWITKGRIPYPKHRHKIAAMARESESYLWPDSVSPERKAQTAAAELVSMFPHRNAIPTDLWDRIIGKSEKTIDVLAHAALFLVERPRFTKDLITKAETGAKIRLLFGDPDSGSVRIRGEEEDLGDGTLKARIHNALTYYRPLRNVDGVEIRFHDTTLYNSVFRFDDEMIVNTHAYGLQGAHAPALHLRRLSVGGLFETYAESFEAVWNLAKPAVF